MNSFVHIKITKSNLSEQVYEQIRDMILKKEIAAGERIPEEKLHYNLGAGRPSERRSDSFPTRGW